MGGSARPFNAEQRAEADAAGKRLVINSQNCIHCKTCSAGARAKCRLVAAENAVTDLVLLPQVPTQDFTWMLSEKFGKSDRITGNARGCKEETLEAGRVEPQAQEKKPEGKVEQRARQGQRKHKARSASPKPTPSRHRPAHARAHAHTWFSSPCLFSPSPDARGRRTRNGR